MGDIVAKAELFRQLAAVGKSLGNGKRLLLLDLLAQGERSVEALALEAGLGLTTASAHLQLLKQAGLVATRREGTRIFYDLAGADVARLCLQLRAVAAARAQEVRRARDRYLGAAQPDGEGGREVTRDELMRAAAGGRVTVLDVRPAEEYAAGHIPGAVSIPLQELERRLDELPAGRDVVAYCRGEYCVLSREASAILRAHGRPTTRLRDGILEWRAAGLPLERSRAA